MLVYVCIYMYIYIHVLYIYIYVEHIHIYNMCIIQGVYTYLEVTVINRIEPAEDKTPRSWYYQKWCSYVCVCVYGIYINIYHVYIYIYMEPGKKNAR